MLNNRALTQSLQILAGLAFCMLWRLSPVRPPNVEPILATLMPFGRRYGALTGFAFAVLSMVVYDAITSGITQWTAVTAVTYGLIGLASPLVVQGKYPLVRYVGYAVVATLFYDAITGVAAGAVLFGMSWKTGLIGQVPFTINHLIGNTLLAVALSPLVDWLLWKTSKQRVKFGQNADLRSAQ